MRILADTGLRFLAPDAIRHFKQAGARVEGDRVFLDESLVSASLQTAPGMFTLHARNSAHNVTIGGDHCAVMPGGGPPFVLDLDGVRRPGTLADLENFARLSQISPEINVMARKAVEAQDVPVAFRHLACWRSILTLTDKPAQSGMLGGRAEAEDILQMLAIVFGDEASIQDRPVAQCSVNVNSPLVYDKAMLESMMAFAAYGQPVLISPFVMAGVTGPATLAGSLAQHNAEVLAGVVLAQLVHPGAPVVYGSASSNVDLRSGAPAIGSPESGVNIAACAQLARHYGLPSRGGGALTDSPTTDSQAGFERMFTLLTSVLSGVNFLMHGVGILESYLTLSYTQFVMDLELLNMVARLVQPLDISDDTLALGAIHAVGPGGFHLDTAHTRQHSRQAHFLPEVSLRQSYEQWSDEGRLTTAERAAMRCAELLKQYEKPPMDARVRDRLESYVERRKIQLTDSPADSQA